MDLTLRELERRANAGDMHARDMLYHRLFSLGQLNPDHIYLTTTPHKDILFAYRAVPYKGRWHPEGTWYNTFQSLLDAKELALVYSDAAIFSDSRGAIVCDVDTREGSELDEFLATYEDQLPILLEGGAVLIQNPVILLSDLGPKDLYHREYYNKENIYDQDYEDAVGFEHEEVTFGVKLPGEPFQAVIAYNMFSNIQLLATHLSKTLDPMEFFSPGYSPGYPTGFVENQRLFGDVYMFVSDYPHDKEPNFHVMYPPMMDKNSPRIMEMLGNVKYVDPSIEQYFQPRIQTIMGPAVFAKLRSDWDGIDYTKLPWPWNEYHQEEAESGAGYPSSLEIQGLNANELAIVEEFVRTGQLPQ